MHTFRNTTPTKKHPSKNTPLIRGEAEGHRFERMCFNPYGLYYINRFEKESSSSAYESMVKGDRSVNGIGKVVKHLEMTQSVINRLGRNSFLLKSWSMIILVAAMVLVARENLENPYFVLALLLPVAGFWILDGYFLWQERLFRQVYNDIRQQTDTDFKMDLAKHKDKPKCSWLSAIFSITLTIFYLIEVLFVLVMGKLGIF